MKTIKIVALILALTFTSAAFAQTQSKTDKIDNTFQKGHQAIAKTQSIIKVFQPYLIKAQELYYQEKQLLGEVKNSAKKGNFIWKFVFSSVILTQTAWTQQAHQDWCACCSARNMLV